MEAHYRIELLGGLRVEQRGRVVSHFRTQKTGALLAYLAYNRQRTHSREELIELLWPGCDAQAGRNSLNTAVSSLRRQLEPYGVPAGTILVADRTSVQLNPAAVITDVTEFEAALKSAVGAQSSRERAHWLAQAVELYRGELLTGHFEDWILQERLWLAERYFQALSQLLTHLEREGDLHRAFEYAHRGVSADPLREEAHCELMRLYATAGQPSAALRQYRELERLLMEQLGTTPAAATRALALDIGHQTAIRPHSPPGPRMTAPSGSACSDGQLLAQAEGENRLVTVLFADMSRSAEMIGSLDPEDAAGLINRLLQTMIDALLKYEGRIDRFLGDGVLAVFGTPIAHEDDAERAIRAALEIREAAARFGHPITAGINTGTVYAGAIGTERHQETTVVGPVVNLASRLQEHAGPGQILIGEVTYHLTRRAFEFSSHPLAARGITEPITAYAVLRALARPEKARGIEGLRAPLIGREEELTKLRAALARILPSSTPESESGEAARGQIVSLIGEAGVGKSRLIAELKRWAVGSRLSAVGEDGPVTADSRQPTADGLNTDSRRPMADGLLWLEGRCLELAVTDRYSLFVDLLRHYFAWPAEEEEASRVARIDAALRDLAASGALSAARAGEIGPLLADLFSLRWGQERGDASRDVEIKNTDPEQRRHQTFLAIRDFLLALARQRPLVLVLEDLHWVDSLSLDLISLLMESLSQAPLLLLCSFRPDPEHRCSRLGTIAAQKCPESYTELRPRELTPTQSQQLVASLLGTGELPRPVKALILDRSRGNPFFTEELVQSLLDRGVLYQQDGTWCVQEQAGSLPVPESVQGMILSRVDRLNPEVKRVLQNASVIGRVFHRRLLAAVESPELRVERPADAHLSALSTHNSQLSTALWALEERGLIYQERVVPEEEYSFRHVLLQETIYDSILRSQRADLHLQVAQAIERLHGERLEACYEQLAFHYERSGTDELTQQRALDYLIRAAERAHRTAAHREEAARLAQAIAMAERLGRRQQGADLRARRGMALSRNGRWAEAKAELQTALAELPPDRVEARAEILVDLANVCFWGVDAPRVRPYAREGMALAEAARREDLAGTAMVWLAIADQMDGELRAGVRRYEQAMKRAGGLRTAPVLAGAPLNRYWLGEYPEALQLARQAVAVIRGLNNTSATVFALSHLGLALAATGAYAEAMSVFAEARQFGIESEVGHFVARAAAMSAGFHLDIYDFPGNEARAEEARDLARQAGFMPTVVSAGIDLLLNFARCGEVGRTEKLVAEVTEGAAQVGGWHGWLWKLRLAQARAEIALARGDAAAAQRLADESIEQSRRRERVKYQVAGLVTRGQALAAQKCCREALRDLHLAVDLARPTGDPAMFLRAAAALLALDGDGDLAAEAQAAAQRIAAALPDEEMRRRFGAAVPARLLSVLG